MTDSASPRVAVAKWLEDHYSRLRIFGWRAPDWFDEADEILALLAIPAAPREPSEEAWQAACSALGPIDDPPATLSAALRAAYAVDFPAAGPSPGEEPQG